MLKKAGIVVVATAAALLAASPLAFADNGGGLINVSDLGVQVPVQLCGNDIAAGVLGVLAGDLDNESDDETDCEQDNEIDD